MYVFPSLQMLPTINETEASITLKMVEEIDCGEYRLKLSNDCGTAYADFIVKLLGECLGCFCTQSLAYLSQHSRIKCEAGFTVNVDKYQ